MIRWGLAIWLHRLPGFVCKSFCFTFLFSLLNPGAPSTPRPPQVSPTAHWSRRVTFHIGFTALQRCVRKNKVAAGICCVCTSAPGSELTACWSNAERSRDHEQGETFRARITPSSEIWSRSTVMTTKPWRHPEYVEPVESLALLWKRNSSLKSLKKWVN